MPRYIIQAAAEDEAIKYCQESFVSIHSFIDRFLEHVTSASIICFSLKTRNISRLQCFYSTACIPLKFGIPGFASLTYMLHLETAVLMADSLSLVA